GSVIEIYEDNIIDLLLDKETRQISKCKLFHGKGSPVVLNLTWLDVSDSNDMGKLIGATER
ncbi:hypothetical protein MKW94_004817, partial [Papaver nudicaule]|nr:hypothetical protein [Papaver nudicaule]